MHENSRELLLSRLPSWKIVSSGSPLLLQICP